MDVDAVGRRPTLTLDGLWDFEFEGPTARLDGEGHTIRTPGIWQTQFPALRNAQGIGRYRRGVQIPADWAGKSIHLILDGVFHESVILVDEAAVAVHGDGWTTIDVDLTEALAGKTSFVLGVDARVPDDRNGGRFSQSLAAKQDWYGVQGGIWKSARLEARDPIHIAKASRANIVRPQDGRCVGERRDIARRRRDNSAGHAFARRPTGRASDLSFPNKSIRSDARPSRG